MSEASKTPEEQLEQNYAEIGRDFCDQILKWEPNYSWNESPLEYLFQLADQRDEALDRAQRAEAERDDLIHDIARHLAICSEQSSKIAELEKDAARLDWWGGDIRNAIDKAMAEGKTAREALASSGQGATEPSS